MSNIATETIAGIKKLLGMSEEIKAEVKASEVASTPEVSPENKSAESEKKVDEKPEVKTELNSELSDRLSTLEKLVSDLAEINKTTVEKLNSEIVKSTELSKKLDLATTAKPLKKIHDESVDYSKMTPFQLHRYSKNK